MASGTLNVSNKIFVMRAFDSLWSFAVLVKSNISDVLGATGEQSTQGGRERRQRQGQPSRRRNDGNPGLRDLLCG